jgi:uncharacterized protein (DUF3084 family)
MGTAKRDAQVEAALKNHTEISQVKETAADERNFDLREDLKDLRDQLRLAVAEMHSVASETARLQASQDVVNKVTAKALESIETKMDKHEQAISDHAATLRLVTELLTKRNAEVPKG